MKKWFLGILLLCLTACNVNQTKAFDSLQTLTFEELDQKIEKQESFAVYFGWVENCGDSIHFQDNYLESHLAKDSAFQNLYVVNLDEELPDALVDKSKREVMFSKYGVQYSPTLVYYEKGGIKEFLEWTPETTDKETGILKQKLDRFFETIGYL